MTLYNTSQRKKLMSFLKENPDKQFSVKQIYDAISDNSISLSAIYRNISVLESEGVITRFSKEGSREVSYQYTHAKGCINCIHLTCIKCGKTFHMNSEESEKMVKSLKTKDGFELNKLKTVLYGACKNCV